MRITKITVENYRILRNFELDLEKELSVVIGKNNSGKTSLLSILDKFIGRKANTNAFVWDDFSVTFQNKLRTLVEQDQQIIDEVFPIGLSLNLFLEYSENDNTSNVSDLMMDLDENNNTIVIEFCYTLSFDMLETLRADFQRWTAKKRSENDTENTGQLENGSIFSNFMKDEFKKYFKIERNSREYDNDNQRGGSARKPIENDNKVIDRIIHFRSISARRTVSNSDTNNALSLLAFAYYQRAEEKDTPDAAIEEFKQLIANTDPKIDKVYKRLFSGIIDKIKTFGGFKKNDTQVEILSSLQSRELLKGNTTVKYTHDDGHLLPENHNGLGYLNLIGMIFEIEAILAEYWKDGRPNERPADINLLFIEEPEAHTHPQMQYVFINNIKQILETGSSRDGGDAINLQAMISTHSSHIVSECDFNDIKYLYQKEDRYVKAKNLKDLKTEYKKDGNEGVQRFKFLRQYLTLHRSELFFADKAIFIEGDTERILLPAMMKKIDLSASGDAVPLLSQFISIIDTGNYAHVFGRFIDFLGIRSLIITDLDPGKHENNDSQSIKKCRPCEATTTMNASLKRFFAEPIGQPTKKNEFNILKDLGCDKKIIEKSKVETNGLAWTSSDHGRIRIAYQIEETNKENKNELAGSFEDAFFHINRQFVQKNKDIFQSLKNKELLDDHTKDAWEVAQHCIDKKPSFAIEILLASENDYGTWDIPKYIQEGLIWLKND